MGFSGCLFAFSPQFVDEMPWHHEMKPWEPVVCWKLPRIPGFLSVVRLSIRNQSLRATK